MEHTKTPWRVGCAGAVVADEPVPEIHGSEAVDCYGGHLIAESIAPRNAEFIVRACNSHDQLVSALQAILTNMSNGPYLFKDSGELRAARAALTAAGAA